MTAQPANVSVQQRHTYRPPATIEHDQLDRLVRGRGYEIAASAQGALLRGTDVTHSPIHFAGRLSLLERPCVAIVGAREATPAGSSRAFKLARELVGHDVVVVSGLARGIDAAAHYGAIDNGGDTIAVIGTPLNKASPSENAALQERIYRDHLLISPFANGEPTFRSSFPKRNRVMALLSDATVIVEASDTSGTLHQASECLHQGRWLFILRSVVEGGEVNWPSRFLSNPRTVVLSNTDEILQRIRA